MNQTVEKAKKRLNQLVHYEKVDNTIYFKGTKEIVELKVLSDEIIRVRLAPRGFFLDDFSYAIENSNFDITSLETEESDDAICVKTASLNCYIEKETMQLRIEDKSGLVINEDEKGVHWEENSDHGGNYVYCSKRIQDDECFYGLGDKPSDLNLRGKRYSNWGSDTYGYQKDRDPLYRNIPFYLGLHHGVGYGILFDNTFKSYFDFGKEDPDVASFWADGGELCYYFIHGPQLLEVVQKYSDLTGRHKLPPQWALGYHQCRWSYYPESTVKDLAHNFRVKKIPCDAIYLDIDYMDGYRCFTWNKDHFPDPKRMISELKEDGFKTVVIIDPGIKVDDNYWVYIEGLENGHFCQRGDGPLMEGSVWPGKCNFPDFTNPEVREWWGKLFEEFVEIGVDGVWNDMNEPAVFGIETFPDDVRHDFDGHPCTHRKAHNIYGMQMVRSTYEGLLKLQKTKRPFAITRSGYAGVQRYSAVWTGDNVATWEHLQIANVQCQRLSISGISFVGSDIGGFTQDSNGELFARWIQLGVFSPLFRTHSAGDTMDQEPWSYGEECEDIVRKFINLRYQLLPYIYTTFWQCSIHGMPMLRPLVFIEQNHKETHHRQDEFCFGDHLLVCPVSEPGVKGRKLYLPEGGWYYYFSDKYYQGGEEIWIDTPIDEMPLFTKSGSVIPHFPVMQYVGEKVVETLTLHVYYKNGEEISHLYEDHGDNFAYEQGICSVKSFSLLGDENSLHLIQYTHGDFIPSYHDVELIFHGIKADKISISQDGKTSKKVTKQKDNTFSIKAIRDFESINIDFE
ncbi:glycoside hydrolase family 31 protein [Fulvivirgaceae bacterium BMA12]|uniref:Glycoside hydrolase family 31 protein n=1 Tax=Agaribacillus aureus TaxID=3051825 RepID=A0ABT8LG71_9BACT|nr:glycoside hydrolase family 31 protein [Fulvivirgaceae bacterium BMA12]